MQNTNMQVFKKLYQNRKHIVLFVGVISMLVFASTFLLKPRFRSLAYVYPANMIPPFLDQQFNTVSHTELLLQFFNSENVRNKLQTDFQLGKRYGINPGTEKFKTFYRLQYDEHIKISQTRYESIEISVLDENPDTAKLLASAIINTVNILIRQEHAKKFDEYVQNNQLYLETHRRAMDSLQNLMEVFSEKYQLIDMGAQMREAAKNYYKQIADGKVTEGLKIEMDKISKHGPEFYKLSASLQEEARLYALLSLDLDKAIGDFNRKLTFMIVPSEPSLPDEKYWPKRGWILFLTIFSSTLLATVYFIYIESLKNFIKSIKN